MSPRRNVLHTQHSPYLLQHKDNPVWWQPWGDEAFEMARREDKPVFLSIGYSTCYWCHVMEHDSFEHQEVADVLNEHFVCIKVDREELPDVDQIYMDVVLGIHGHGGWPMSVFLTPERKPFWGGTFFYRDPFIKILRALSDAWKNERERVLVSSDELTRYLQSKQGSPAGRLIDQATARQAKIDLLSRFDQTYGGFGGAPKFPPSQQLQLLMQLYRSERDAASEEVTRATLTSMACGGICDQLGGGFHRYSVDAAWLVPHFEKMLYDNALLIPLYLDAYTMTNDERFRDVAASACEYLLRDMRDGGGAFFAAEDAGEVGNEGEFYVWTEDEVRRVLSPEVSDRVCATYGITPEGNFEHGATVLSLSRTGDWQDTRHHDLRVAREKLLEQRARRERPHRDDKILTSWNGLCVTAFSRAYKVLRVESYRAAAVECAAFILDKLHGGSKLLRRYCKGDARFDATLEDYAYLIQGLLELYEITGDDQWLERAALLQEEQRRSLWLAERRAFASSAAPGNIVQLCEWADGATPAANAISLGNLRRLEAVTGDLRYGQWADELEQGIPEEVFEAPSRYCSTLRAALLGRVGVQTCCVVTPNASAEPDSAIFDLWRDFCPYTTVVWCSQGSHPGPMVRGKLPRDGRTTWYVCQHRSCGEPVFEFTGDMAAGPRDIRHT